MREFRLLLGLTQIQMAIAVKVSNSLYEKVEIGTRKPSSEFISKFKKEYPQFDANSFFN